ncbi:MAG: YhjD/YihY/BrkB family envelope integrity protein, partial [Bacilli bacterium]
MKALILETIAILREGKHRWIPSSISFYFIISIIPLFFIFLILAANTDIESDWLFNLLSKNEEFNTFLNDLTSYININYSNTSMITLILLLSYSIYLSSNAITGLIHSINSFFNFEKRNFIITKIYSIIINLLIIILLTTVIFIINILPLFLKLFDIELGFYFSYLIALPVLYIVIYAIYLLSSNFRLRFNEINKGAIFTSISIYGLILGSTV